MKCKVSFYKTPSGRMPVFDYVNELTVDERTRVFDAIDEIEAFGFRATRAKFRHIQGKLWEIKISANRIFYVLLEGDHIMLLHAYKKQSQKLPRKEYELALQRMKEFL